VKRARGEQNTVDERRSEVWLTTQYLHGIQWIGAIWCRRRPIQSLFRHLLSNAATWKSNESRSLCRTNPQEELNSPGWSIPGRPTLRIVPKSPVGGNHAKGSEGWTSSPETGKESRRGWVGRWPGLDRQIWQSRAERGRQLTLGLPHRGIGGRRWTSQGSLAQVRQDVFIQGRPFSLWVARGMWERRTSIPVAVNPGFERLWGVDVLTMPELGCNGLACRGAGGNVASKFLHEELCVLWDGPGYPVHSRRIIWNFGRREWPGPSSDKAAVATASADTPGLGNGVSGSSQVHSSSRVDDISWRMIALYMDERYVNRKWGVDGLIWRVRWNSQ
jgi:hypothetical protein